MRALVVCVIGLVAALAAPAAQQRLSGALTPQIESVLKKIKAADKGQLAVSEEDGRFLRVLIATRSAKSILEIGARDVEANFELREAMSSFREITEYMATVHGRRKSLLLFSQGYPQEIYRAMDYQGGVLSLPQEDMHHAITAATRNNVVIYPIDPRGLSEDGGLAESETGPSTDPDARLGASFARLEARQSLTALAAATGGFALSNSNSFENAFDRIVQENSTYYVLGFSSTNERRDGRYRKLDVRVKPRRSLRSPTP